MSILWSGLREVELCGRTPSSANTRIAGASQQPAPAARPRATAERFVEARVAGATLADSHVVITDVRIPFWSLVWLLVKLAFAAIPAAILVTVIWMIVIGRIGGMLQPHSL